MDNILDKLALLNSPEYEAARRTLEFFYEALSVLDHKAEALMVFDGILIAAATFILDRGNLHRIHKWRRLLVLLAILLALLAAGACLFVARVKYSFLGDMTIVGGKLQTSEEFHALAVALARRTFDYELAWYLSVGAICLSILVAASSFIFPILTDEDDKMDRS
jgi:Na+-driven multidrug efflux pump